MPSKRPAPLSDAALFSGRPVAAAAPAAAPGGPLGETNDGVPLPVKNTFIDVPSGLTPSNMQSAAAARNQMLNTAPAELNVAPGFIKRSILASSAGQTAAAVEASTAVGSIGPVPASPQAVTMAMPVSPTKRGLAGVVQRPVLSDKSVVPGSSHGVPGSSHGVPGSSHGVPGSSHGVPGSSHGVPGSSHGYTPMMTPSPTGSSLFTVHRYQLFGGPAPVTEATHSALAPGGIGSYSASLTGPSPLSPKRQLPSGPLTAAAAAASQTSVATATSVTATTAAAWPGSLSTHGATQTSTFSPGVPIISAGTYSRPAHAAALQTEQMQQLKEREGEDDEDDSDDEEAQQQAQQQGAGAAKTPEEAPKPPPGAIHPSLGSDQHAEGTCKRCCFYPRNRCLNGYNCDFCHYDHEKRKRKSKKKKKKDKAGDLALPTGFEASAFEACGTSMGVGMPLSAPPAALPMAPTVAAPAHIAALPTHPAGSLLAAPAEPPPPMGLPTMAPTMEGFYEYGGASAAYSHQYASSSGATLAAPYQAAPSATATLATTVSAPSYFAPATGSTAQSAMESQRLVLPTEQVHLLGTNPQAARYVVPSGGEISQALYSTPAQQMQTYSPQQVTYPAPVEPNALSAGPPLYEATVPSAPVPLHSAQASAAVASTLPAHAPPSAPPTQLASLSVYKPPAAPPTLQAAGPWAPPVEAPNLPQDVHFVEDMAPPPLEAPRAFPPTPHAAAPAFITAGAATTAPVASAAAASSMSAAAAAAAPKAPPPMSSPKLPKNMVLSLQAQQGMPAPPVN